MFGYLGAFLSGIGAAYVIEKWGWYGVFIACGISCLISMFFVALTWKKEAYNHSTEEKKA
jgi:OPA family sugar phosphate sensor protein UhpC-like MFS transporter